MTAPTFGSRSTFLVVIIAHLGLMSTSARAEDDDHFCDSVTMQLDNDEMGGTDQNYTGGLRLACVTSPPSFLENAILPASDDGGVVERRATFAAGLSIFTPDDIARREPIEDDHPYAGWLYLGFGLERDTALSPRNLAFLDSFEVQLGVVGPLAGAEPVQRATHDLLNATDPQGWGNQLDNEPGFNLFYSRQWTGVKAVDIAHGDRLSRLALDATPEVGLAVGNIHIFGGAGLMLRFGSLPPGDHGPPVTRPSLPGSDFFQSQDGLSAYAFASLEGRAVARNIFLDGNSFQDDGPSVDKKPLLGEGRLGLVVAYDDIRFTYTHVFRSREFDGQDPHTYGSVSLSFNL